MRESLATAWLSLQRQMLHGVSQCFVVVGGAQSDRLDLHARWPETAEIDPVLIEVTRKALRHGQTVLQSAGDANPVTRVSCPVIVDGRAVAAVGFSIEDPSGDLAKSVVSEVQRGTAFLSLMTLQEASRSPAMATTEMGASELLARAFCHESLDTIALAITTDLASRLGCARVSLGLRRSDGIRVEAISGRTEHQHRSDPVRQIEAAMCEVLESKTPLLYNASDDEPAAEVSAHWRLSEGGGARYLLSLVLHHAGRSVGVLVFERSSGRPFDPADVAYAESVGDVLGPMLVLKQSNEIPWRRRCANALASGLSQIRDPSNLKGRAALVCLAGLVMLLVFAKGDYRVAASATIEGAVHRAVVAPFEGYVESAFASAGDVVAAGQLLATLQERDLDLERKKRSHERDELGRLYDRALSELDHAEAGVFTTRKAQVDLELELLAERSARTQLTAPIEGVIVAGDLSRSLGMPVERGQVLFEVAPLDGYRVILWVDERDVVELSLDQPGRLALTALPGERFDMIVEKITPVAQVESGRNVFRAEARLEGNESALRPGMEGVGKVTVGRRSLVWIATHRLVDWVRLQIWTWRP